MSLELLRSFLLWCTLVNYGILLFWFVLFVFARDWIQRLHGRWFRLAPNQFDVLHYGAMAVFKLGIMLLNLVPFVVLSLLVE